MVEMLAKLGRDTAAGNLRQAEIAGERLPDPAAEQAPRRLVETEVLEFDDGESVVRALTLAEEGADFADALIEGTMELFGVDETVTFDRRASERIGWRLLA